MPRLCHNTRRASECHVSTAIQDVQVNATSDRVYLHKHQTPRKSTLILHNIPQIALDFNFESNLESNARAFKQECTNTAPSNREMHQPEQRIIDHLSILLTKNLLEIGVLLQKIKWEQNKDLLRLYTQVARCMSVGWFQHC